MILGKTVGNVLKENGIEPALQLKRTTRGFSQCRTRLPNKRRPTTPDRIIYTMEVEPQEAVFSHNVGVALENNEMQFFFKKE